MRLRADDEVYRIRSVWLGPKGWTLPWTARYVAYAVWLFTFVGILLLEALLWHVSVIPIWEFCGSIVLTGAIMRVVDHDTSVRSAVRIVFAELHALATLRRIKQEVTIMLRLRYRTRESYDGAHLDSRRRVETAARGLTLRPALTEINDNLTLSVREVIAWYVLRPQRWSFRSDSERQALLLAYADRLAALAGHRIVIRVTHRPYPVAHWARALDQATPEPLAAVNDNSWSAHLRDAQRHLHSVTFADKLVFVGVHIARRSHLDRALTFLNRHATTWELDKIQDHRIVIDDVIAGTGIEGRRATTRELEWLLHRSIAIGAPVGKLSASPVRRWLSDDLRTFTDAVKLTPIGILSDVTKIVTRREGLPTEHYATALTLGRVGELSLPESGRDPWMQHVEHLSFPVDLVATFDVIRGVDAHRQVQHRLQVVRDMQDHYAEHGMDEPLVLERQAQRAREVEDEMTQGVDVQSARAHGWVRLVVTGDTEEECRKRARQVIEHYRTIQMDVVRPRAQLKLLCELIPHEPVKITSHTRRMPILYLAAGLPTVTTMIGDQRGPYLGYTSGSSRRAVCFDTHYPTEVRESSGLTPVVGSLGSGKSVLLGLSTYEATRRGIPCTILDPSGPLARLTDLPEFTGHARHINLLRAQPGTLNPYSVIASPIRAQFDLDPEVRALAHEVDRQACADELYAEATQEADNDRRVLATDVVRMLLPPMVDVLPATQLVIGDAIRAVGGRRTATLTQVIEHLDRHDDSHGKIVANHLRDVRDMAGARLFFSSGELRPRDAEEPTLLVLTMAGLTLPSRDVAREYWSTAERLTVPLLHLAAYYAARRIYGRDMGARKLIALDEVGQMIEWASGRALFTRLGRDSRKWNTCVFAASQSPSDVLGVGESIGNLFGTTFVGRIEDEPTAREALRLLRVPAGVGYEQVLAGLSPYADVGRVGAREFVMRDVEGRIEKIRVDLTHLPNLLTALNTTAAP